MNNTTSVINARCNYKFVAKIDAMKRLLYFVKLFSTIQARFLRHWNPEHSSFGRRQKSATPASTSHNTLEKLSLQISESSGDIVR